MIGGVNVDVFSRALRELRQDDVAWLRPACRFRDAAGRRGRAVPVRSAATGGAVQRAVPATLTASPIRSPQ